MREGGRNGKIAGLNLFAPPPPNRDRIKLLVQLPPPTTHPFFFKGGIFWLNLEASHVKTPLNLFVPLFQHGYNFFCRGKT